MTEMTEWQPEWTKLHSMVPTKLFNELKRRKLLNNIDTLIIQLLTKHLEGLK